MLKPITKKPAMKEYLNKLEDGTYKLVLLDSVADGVEGLIEVPEGADTLAGDSSTRYFWKHGFGEKGNMIIGVGESLTRYSGWTGCEGSADEWLGQINCENSRILWQRETLNDKVATAEVARQESKEWDLGDYAFAESDALIESNVEQSSIVKTLAERQSIYGDFSKVAEMTQGLLFVMSQYGYNDMPDTHKESIHMIASKLARIVNGDNNHLDSWHDIGGYSKLIENLIKSDDGNP